MLFNSVEYLIFLPTVVTIYFLIPQKFRWGLLLGTSYYFYMSWKPEYIILIIISTLVDYYVGLQMGKFTTKKERRPYLIFSLCSNLGLLFAFKYFNFFNDSLRAFFHSINIFYDVPAFNVLLPVGISFYTFQTLSYSIEVYRGIQKPEKHLGIFALYVSFFPQLVAGPIERSVRLLPQFYQIHKFDYQRIASGSRLIAWGLFKKMVIADQVAIFVNAIYGDPTKYTGLPLILATFFFAYQIYCDFSGYSDIAIGSARLMGFDLMKNFDQPYLSKSIPEFWRRWHISLSTWFRDYLYIPLGGSRVSTSRWYINVMIVFVVSGLWHGANWTFVVWGALHGVYMVVTFILSPYLSKVIPHRKSPLTVFLFQLINILITFLLVNFAWIFFRANSVTDAFYIITHLFVDFTLDLSFGVGFGKTTTIITIICIIFMETVDFIYRNKWLNFDFSIQPIWVRWSFYYVVIMLIMLFGNMDTTAQFIYFQF